MKLRQKIEHALWDFAAESGIYRGLRWWYGGLGSVLCLHRVVPASERARLAANRELEVTPETLEEIFRFFARHGYEAVSLDQLETRLQSPHPAKFVAYTFDDGYADNESVALPLFKKHRIPFTVYVTTSFPDRRAILWWYALESVLQRDEHLSFAFEGKRFALELATAERKNRAFDELKAIAMRLSEPKLVEFFAAMGMPAAELNGYVERLALSWDGVRRLASEPLVSLGAHTVTHQPLASLPAAQAREEIAASKARLEREIGRSVRHFCYPFGNDQTAGTREFALARECGFQTATTTRAGNLFAVHADTPHALPRIVVDGNTISSDRLEQWISGLPLARSHRFKRVVTT